jgi:hypothetical protein
MNAESKTTNDAMMLCPSDCLRCDMSVTPTLLQHDAVANSSTIYSYIQRHREVSLGVINLNYEGIVLLQQRPRNQYQHAAALTKFGQALDLLRSGIDNELFHDQIGLVSTEAAHNAVATTKVGSIQSVPICTQDEQTLSEQASPHNACALYERAFYIDPTNSRYMDLSDVDLSIVIMVNMAVTCHQCGLLKGAQSDMYLQKALGLYKMTSSLILREADGKFENGLKSSSTIRLLQSKTIVLAIFNNMMHLQSHFLLNNETLECGKKLVYILKHNYIATVTVAEGTTIPTAASATLVKETQRCNLLLQQEKQRNVYFQENVNEDHSIFILNALLVSRSIIARLAPAA